MMFERSLSRWFLIITMTGALGVCLSLQSLEGQGIDGTSVVIAGKVVPAFGSPWQEDDSPESLLDGFAERWDESKWENQFRGMKYMRTGEDKGWKIRMEVMRSLVAAGKESMPVLEKHLGSNHAPTRILAAQTMGYLAQYANVDLLSKVIRTDTDAAVRLYAVDALGMSGKGSQVDWDSFAKGEKNGDVVKHINYARERGDSGVTAATAEGLAKIRTADMDAAAVGKPAPDFALRSVDGTEYQLSQLRGKHPVVLIFIYGDT